MIIQSKKTILLLKRRKLELSSTITIKTEIEKTDFFKKNKEKYEIVSIDGKAVNKQLKMLGKMIIAL